MTDLSRTIAPKSDQLNADDLIAGPRTITVSRVSLMGEPDQPIAIGYEGDGGKPYKPCKSMRRVMVHIWGSDGTAYAGRRMTLYRDDKVVFGGQAVGGIRISHMSDMDREVTLALTATRASRKPYTVKPLPAVAPSALPAVESQPEPRLFTAARQKAGEGSFTLAEWMERLKPEQCDALTAIQDELDAIAEGADERLAREDQPEETADA